MTISNFLYFLFYIILFYIEYFLFINIADNYFNKISKIINARYSLLYILIFMFMSPITGYNKKQNYNYKFLKCYYLKFIFYLI